MCVSIHVLITISAREDLQKASGTMQIILQGMQSSIPDVVDVKPLAFLMIGSMERGNKIFRYQVCVVKFAVSLQVLIFTVGLLIKELGEQKHVPNYQRQRLWRHRTYCGTVFCWRVYEQTLCVFSQSGDWTGI